MQWRWNWVAFFAHLLLQLSPGLLLNYECFSHISFLPSS